MVEKPSALDELIIIIKYLFSMMTLIRDGKEKWDDIDETVINRC